MSDEVVDVLKEQFRRQWRTIRDLVDKTPDDQWRAGEIPLVPARLVYHILSGTELYARTCTYEEYVARRKFAEDWLVMPADGLPDRPTTLRHIDDMERAVVVWLGVLGDEGLFTTEDGFPWTGSKKLSRALYLMRHTQHHVGEANSELRQRGIPRGAWG